MFNFFKKKDYKEPPASAKETLGEKEIDDINNQLTNLENNKNLNKEEILEKKGILQAKLGDQDQAIKSLEESMSLKPSVGEGYKELMSLYNSKRASSAKNGDDKGIEYYMDKMDELRQIARKYTIG